MNKSFAFFFITRITPKTQKGHKTCGPGGMKEGSRSGVLQVFEKVLLSIIGRRRRFAGRSQEENEVSAVAEWDISKAGDQTHLNNW